MTLREEIIDRIMELHETWFLEELVYNNRHYYRIKTSSRHRKPLFKNYFTGSQILAWLNGYEIGTKTATTASD